MPKTCAICNESCEDQPRVRDKAGRYYCRACYDTALERRADTAAANPAAAPTPTTACPSCGVALTHGAVLCVSCGFSTQATLATTTEVARPPREPGAGRRLASPWMLSVGVSLVFIVAAAVAFVTPNGLLAMLALYFLGWVAFSLVALIEPFRHSVGTGIACLFIPFYLWYFVCTHSPPLIRHALFGMLVATVALVAVFPIAMSRHVETENSRYNTPMQRPTSFP